MLRAVLLAVVLARCSLTYEDHPMHPRTLTFFTDASQEYYARFSRVVYSVNMPYFDFADYKQGKYYIADPHIPIEFDRYKYYWNETFMNLTTVSNLCEYRINTYIDKELSTTFYRNGTQPTSLLFACSWSQRCQGLECKMELPLLPCLVLPLVILYAMFRYAKKEMKRAFDEAPKRRAAIIQSMVRTMSVQMEPTNPDGPPSYDSITNSSSPPSYDAVMGKYVTYTLPKHIPFPK